MKDGSKRGILSGAGSGVVASLCCVGPLVIILFGLGTVSFALSIAQYRLYFIALGIFFLALTIFLHLRSNKTCNIQGLKKEKHFVIATVLSMGVIYFATLYVVVPTIAPAIYGDARDPGPVDNPDLRKLTLKIDGMTCQGCADTIENALHGMGGVAGVKVSYPLGTGEVIYDPGKITREQIVGSNVFSKETGYTVEVISDETV